MTKTSINLIDHNKMNNIPIPHKNNKMMHHQHQEIHRIHHEAKLADDENEEFDLHKDYHNAIDCLMHCEHIINDLQGQVIQKDEQIATLEEKLVQMSLELASAKAAEDVLDNINRQLSQSLNSPNVSETDRDVGQVLPAQQTQSSSSRIVTGYAPQKGSSRKNTISMRPQYRSQLSQSWTGSSSNNVTDEQQPTEQLSTSVHQAIGNSVTTAARNLTRSLSKRGNWDANSSSRTRPPWGGSNTNDDSSILDTSWKSANSSTKENMSLGSSARSAPATTKPRQYHRCESSPSIYNMNGMRRTANMDESHPTRRQRRCSEVSSNSRTNVSFIEDESITHRRLSSIGQLLGFTNRNSAVDVAADVVAGHCDNAAWSITSTSNNAQQWQQGQQQQQNQRRDSILSSRSDISGVLFPVTSSDCLIGLEKKMNNIESASPSRRGSYASGNIEW